MNKIVISDMEDINFKDTSVFYLNKIKPKYCVGCWTCWWKTPGRCIHKDLDKLYHEYINADKAIFFSKTVKGFVGCEMKNLFDRMIPLYLPYVSYKTGESMHVPRYEKYPNIEFYYDGEFETIKGRQILEDYVHRVFYQFHSKSIIIKQIEYSDIKDGDKRWKR